MRKDNPHKNIFIARALLNLTTNDHDGKIRSKDNIALSNDPNPPKDKEH